MSLTKVSHSLLSGSAANVTDFGATGNNVANDVPAITAALASTPTVVQFDPAATGYAGDNVNAVSVTVPTGKVLDGTNPHGPLIAGVLAVETNGSIINLNQNTSNAYNLYNNTGAVSGITLNNNTFKGSGSNGVYFNTYAVTDTSITNNAIDTGAYGVILTGVAGGGRVIISGNNITAGNADAIELNLLGGSAKGYVVNGNILSAHKDATGEFAFGQAAAEQIAFVGNVIIDSLLEAVHFEDTQKNNVVVGNSIAGTQDGLKLGNSIVDANSTGLAIVGNSFNSLTAATNTGINLFWDGNGTKRGNAIVGNTVTNYGDGINFGGTVAGTSHVVNLIDGNSTINCTSAISAVGTTAGGIGECRQFGTNYAHNATYLFKTAGKHVSFGKVVSDTIPVGFPSIINSIGYTSYMPSRCDGFAYPIATYTTINGTLNVPLFTLGSCFRGRVKFSSTRGGITNWFHSSATINYDGTTLTVSEPLFAYSGATTISVTYVTDAGKLSCAVTANGAVLFDCNYMEFDGEYWDV